MRISHFLTTLQNVRKAPDHPRCREDNLEDLPHGIYLETDIDMPNYIIFQTFDL